MGGNSLRNGNPHYVYVIKARPGTHGPFGVVGPSGIYKYGIGETDKGHTRLNDQVNALGGAAAGFHGFVLEDAIPNRAQARTLEWALIADYVYDTWLLPPGNLID